MTIKVVIVSVQMTATELKAKLLASLDRVALGEEIEITKHGRTVARLVPARGARAGAGMLAGVAVSDTEDDLLSTGESWESS